MDDAMAAEFDTVADWTADVLHDLGADHLLPATCRGSGSPATLRWFLQRLDLGPADRMLDCGAGLGGPAASAAAEVGVRPILTDPTAGACRGAGRRFELPVVQAASDLPFRSASFDVAWSLGVLCTVADQPRLLTELHRVLTTAGRLGLLVYVAASPPLSQQPAGNNFPTAASLRALVTDAGFRILDSASMPDFAAPPPAWEARAADVDAELERRHGDHPAWQQAAHQAGIMGGLIAGGELVAQLIIATPA